MAKTVEETVRMNGAVPATVGILKGQIHVGLSEEELKFLAQTKDCVKVSRRDLPYVLSQDQATSGSVIEKAIQQALKEARSQAVQGKDVTPFLLRRVNELTGGKSLKSNIALIKNNAAVGSRIAVALSQLPYTRDGRRKHTSARERKDQPGADCRPVVIGGINVDFIAKSNHDAMVFGGQTNSGRVHQSFGGVGRNLADCLSRLGANPLFISAVGQDEHASSVMRYCSHMDMCGVARLKEHNTATYCAVINSTGDLSLGLGDMDIHQQITEDYVAHFAENIRRARLVCIDGNIPLSTIQFVCEIARTSRVPVCFEPTDEDKSCKPFLTDGWTALTFISPNLKELMGINRTLGHPTPLDIPHTVDDIIDTAIYLSLPLLQHLKCVVVTLGANGVLLCGHTDGEALSLNLKNPVRTGERCAVHYPPAPIDAKEIVNVSGAGDSFMSGLLSGVLTELDTDTCVRMGLLSARLSLRSQGPISPLISPTSINPQQVEAVDWPKPRQWNIDPTNGKSGLTQRHQRKS
ncbi:hypothetical protein GDO86_005016 [Hymenochirus boettgeri]|uniref:Carbohydrate kinase PfkB domain-containing protein n=1 Tax=Hymenochirus boettgeri TaxID=247094 RepID=A0A8T2J5E3_9PIPI|nr:hypothetical protein GDO86_005016 [Hymenochirus boettgeri]